MRHLLASNRSLAIGHGVALAAAGSVVLLGIARNLLLVGNWRGRDEMVVSNSVMYALAKTSGAVNVLFLGPSAGPSGNSFILKALFSAFFLAGMAWLTWNYVRHRDPRSRDRRALKGVGIDLLLLAATYAGCMFYAGLTSSISYGLPRNFLPIVALIALLFGLTLQTMLAKLPKASPSRRLSLLALGGSFCFYAWLNLSVARVPPVDRVSLVAERLDSIAGDGRSARSVVRNLAGPQQVIVANNGQAIGYVLGHPAVSLVGPTFSEIRWDEEAMRDVVRRFHAAAIVISAPIAGQPETDDLPSPFVRQLAQGVAPPWLKLVFRSRDHLVYQPQ
jgi:hypothetical protein